MSLLETELFYRICCEIKETYKHHCSSYFQILKYTAEMEEFMVEENFVKCIVNDLMSEYTLEGIAYAYADS